jgi:3-oxoacyl-[acyl-carrier protein] reductase
MICLVTGSSRGLGKAIAIALGKRGHSVVVHCRDKKDEAEGVARQINASFTINADVADPDEVRRSVQYVIETAGGIDMLINNAGITKEALLLKTTEKDFEQVINTNLKGPFNFIRAAAPHMIKRNKGHIINISSLAGVKGMAGLSAYSASKAGLIGLSLTTAAELGRYNIMVNTVLPGFMLTDMGDSSGDKARAGALKQSIVDKFSDPDDVAEFICCLTETSGITGQVFNLDGRIL